VAESALMKEAISKLRADASDLGKSEYKYIKDSLIDLVKLDSRIRFAYIYVQKGDKIYFLADSEASNSPDYSPPGQEYSEASDFDKEPFIDGKPLITPPVTDRWGTWVSALVPIKDRTTGEVKAVFALDYPAQKWNDEAIYSTARVALYFLFLFLLLANSYIIAKKSFKIKEDEEKFKAFSSSTQDAVVIMDGKGKVILWNQAAEKMFGYSESEILGKEFHDYITIKKEHRDKKNIVKFGRTGESTVLDKIIELPVKNKAGKEFEIELSVSRVMVNNNWHAIGIMRDVTIRKKNEEMIQASIKEKDKAVKELERLNKLMVGRELEMVKLKKEIIALKNK
jgi:PAS domain S-box-containing protein